MTPDELVDVVSELAKAERFVTGTQLRKGCSDRGIDIGHNGYGIKAAEDVELSAASPRIVKWKATVGPEVGFTLASENGPFPGWQVHRRSER